MHTHLMNFSSGGVRESHREMHTFSLRFLAKKLHVHVGDSFRPPQGQPMLRGAGHTTDTPAVLRGGGGGGGA